jgi:NADH:ubiquinone oxidoreductase subunit 5 (subunit L)/multisubunit Na+/H+ antiporter MnhA subunit
LPALATRNSAFPAKVITTGALFVSCALSWPIFLSFLGGHAQASVTPVLQWVKSGDLDFLWACGSIRSPRSCWW